MATVPLIEEVRAACAHAYRAAPEVRGRFDRAGMRPEDLRSLADLARLPVLKKEQVVDLQRAAPPFGGMFAGELSEVGRLYVSPGPIVEPELREEEHHHGFDDAFRAFGLGPGDVALNSWSYHLVPAGLQVDDGFRAAGVAVVPAGVGNTEQQARIVVDLGVTCICSSTAFFTDIVDRIQAAGKVLPRDWKVRIAILGGEFGDWMAKRRRIEERYGLKTYAVYGTADFGAVGYEDGQGEGYRVHPRRIVQICDPVTGVPLPRGERGEVVVTKLSRGWPLIRFGTGDASYALETTEDGIATRLALLQGRVGQAVKAREIFVYPRQVDELAVRIAGLRRAQAVVSRPGHREEITLRLAVADGAPRAEVEAAARGLFHELTRLRVERVELLPADGLGDDAPLLVDAKDV